VRRFNGKAGIISSEKQRFKSLPIKLNFKLRNKDRLLPILESICVLHEEMVEENKNQTVLIDIYKDGLKIYTTDSECSCMLKKL
jgi:hypothetical protein